MSNATVVPPAGWLSDPAATLEEEIQRDADAQHERDRVGIAELPVQLGHVVEVHAVDRSHEGGREEDRRPRGDLLDLLVLSVGDLAETLGLEREIDAED